MEHIEMLAWVNVNTSLTTQHRLNALGSNVNIFSDINAFVDDITRNTTQPDSVILVIPGWLVEEIILMIDAFPQLRAIYIYCTDANKYIHLAQQYDKIGIDRIFSDEDQLIARLTNDLRDTALDLEEHNDFNRIFSVEQQNTPKINMFSDASYNKSTRDLTEEKVIFMWLEVLNDILIQMPKLPTAMSEMIEACRLACADDIKQLRMIEEFQRTYKPEDVIHWYTCETFLYRLLNQALRTENVDTIFQFRMIIIDLTQQLACLFQSSAYSTPTLTVYRGQRMTVTEIEKLKNNIGGLISMNSFVSTTIIEAKAHEFSRKYKPGQQEKTVPVVFKLTLDVALAKTINKPFADISKQSRHASEAEVLLSMGTVFRIKSIEPASTGIWYVTAVMCSSFEDAQHKLLFDYCKAEVCSRDRITYSTYGKFLAMMSNFDSAINYLNKLLDQQSSQLQLNNIELATIHNDLAYAYRESFRSSEAIKHYQIALNLKQNRVPIDEIDLAITYSDMGWLLMLMGDLKRAEHFHERALTIRKKDFANNRSDVAMSLNCLGLVYVSQSKLSSAKKYLEEALAIRQSSSPPQHPFIAMSYSSLGSYFEEIGDDAKALKMYEQALAIYKSSVPPTHHILRSAYSDVSQFYFKKKQWQKVIEHIEPILVRTRNPKDDEQAILLNQLGQAYFELRNYQYALANYQEALIIAKNINDNQLISKLTQMIEQIKSNIS